MVESWRTRWGRRAVSIPSMLGLTAVLAFGLPVLLPVAVVADLVRGRARLPLARVYLFGLQYVINDSVEILAAPALWLWSVVASVRGTDPSALHRWVQTWSVRTLVHRAEQLLDLPVVIEGADRIAAGSGPVVVISRHVSLLDASLPGVVFDRLGFSVRGVVMAELLADPGFDLIYRRTGSVFIPRDDGPTAVSMIEAMIDGIDGPDGRDQSTALVIFPEGQLFRRSVRDRRLAKLATTDPERADRLSGLDRLLPPRPGGFNALLDAVPDADVVVLDHDGLDGLRRVSDLVRTVPVGAPVTVTLRRVSRGDLPDGRAERTAWLDQVWLDLDRARKEQSR